MFTSTYSEHVIHQLCLPFFGAVPPAFNSQAGAAGPELAAAVSNAGGLGNIGSLAKISMISMKNRDFSGNI